MKLRRAAALMMVSVMAFAATGCGGGDDTKDSSTSSADKQSAAAGTESGASDDASDEGSDDTSAASGDLKYADITLGEDYKLDLEGEMTFEQSHPFLNISVTEGEAVLNGTEVKKGDHLILPAEFGTVKLEGKAEIIASAVR